MKKKRNEDFKKKMAMKIACQDRVNLCVSGENNNNIKR